MFSTHFPAFQINHKPKGTQPPVSLFSLLLLCEIVGHGTPCPCKRVQNLSPAVYFASACSAAASFSRAERTRPLRPVSHLLCCYFENIPAECFQHIFPLFKLTINQKGHSHLCPFFLCYCCVKSSDTARRAPANVCRTSRRLFTLPVPALRLPALRCKRTLPLPFAALPRWGMWGRYGCSHPPDRHRRGRMRRHR